MSNRFGANLALLLVLTPLMSTPSWAADFVVNSTADVVDANPGDGICETSAGNRVCTLRAAIQEAGALAGSHTITLPSGTYT
ncbi:MAG: CSLREA domain-containing protein, partial [Acidobacteriaceae bacterium]|nr:CSLREA domain-containing protein [Acidobacteriaceae bacterium]